MLLSEVAERTFANFDAKGWPTCLLVTGENSTEKIDFLRRKIAETLHACRREAGDPFSKTLKLMKDGSHPDFFCFSATKIRIGDSEDPEPETVRYLLRHFMPYAPRYSRKKFIFFEDAAQINNEAESALLKSLEEPPPGFHFILAAETAENMKETIVSRCLQIHLPAKPDGSRAPERAWERFWYLNSLDSGPAWQTAVEKNWLTTLQKFYDELSFSAGDYPAFDKLLVQDFKKIFGKEKVELQTQILELSLKPLQFAIRDALVAGPVIELAPFRLPEISRRSLTLMNKILQNYFRRMQFRIFGTIPPNIAAVTASLLSRLMPLWGRSFRK